MGSSPEYLAQLLKDKKQIQSLPNVFIHVEKILDHEISRVTSGLFHHQGQQDVLDLPEPLGPVVQLQDKLFVPVSEYPDFNFVGRILGPRGMTSKGLEQVTSCKVMVRGKGSMRDKAKEDQYRGKTNWEHLSEDLHVLITAEDTRNRAEVKLQRARQEVTRLLMPAPEGHDNLKKRQLMELAVMNGTYRDTKLFQQPDHMAHYSRFLAQPPTFQMQTPDPAGAQIILTSRLPSPTHLPRSHIRATSQASSNEAPSSIVFPPGEHGSLIYNPYGSTKSLSTAVPSHIYNPHSSSGCLSTAVPSHIYNPHSSSGCLSTAVPSNIYNPHSSSGCLSTAVPSNIYNPHSSSGCLSTAVPSNIYNPYSSSGCLSTAVPSNMDLYGITATTPSINEYLVHMGHAHAGAVPKMRRSLDGVRGHPYSQVSLS